MSRTYGFVSPPRALSAAAAAASLSLALLGPATAASAQAQIPGTTLNPTAWLRADALNGLDEQGNPNPLPDAGSFVSSWTDVSGNNRNAAQTTGTAVQPVFNTLMVNNLPTVTFDGSNVSGQGDFMSIANGAWGNAANSFLTMFVVARDTRASNDANNKTVLSTRDASSRGWILSYEPVSGVPTQRYIHIGSVGATNQVRDTLPPNNPPQFHLLEVRRSAINAQNQIPVEIAHDGGPSSTANLTGFTPTSLSTTYIGHNDGNLNRFFKGDLAEIIAFDGTFLTDGDMEQVEQYLMTKYAIAVPEPTGLGALAAAGAALLARRRRGVASGR